MPNGGSDCCGTCRFNRKNKGEVGYKHADDPESPFCVIRELEIENPFYTYCSNHPHHNPNKIDVPVGPVFICIDCMTCERAIWVESPDNESVRLKLLELLDQISEAMPNEYPFGASLPEMIIYQLGIFNEERAIKTLEKIANFDKAKWEVNEFGRSTENLVEAAKKALAQIKG